MYCMNCGKELPEEAKFCFYCGASTTEAGTAQKQGQTQRHTEDNYAANGAAAMLESDLRRIKALLDEMQGHVERGNYKAAANVIRQVLEVMVGHLHRRCGKADYGELKQGIERLFRWNLITEQSYWNYEFLRVVGNNGSHSNGTVTKENLDAAQQILNTELYAFRTYAARDYSGTRRTPQSSDDSQSYPLINLLARVMGFLFTVLGTFFAVDALSNFTGGFFGATGIISAIFDFFFALLGLTLLIGGAKLPMKLLKERISFFRSARRK